MAWLRIYAATSFSFVSFWHSSVSPAQYYVLTLSSQLGKFKFISNLCEGMPMVKKSQRRSFFFFFFLNPEFQRALCESQQTMEILRDGSFRPPSLSSEKLVCGSRCNSFNWTWNNWLVPNCERCMIRLHTVTLFI